MDFTANLHLARTSGAIIITRLESQAAQLEQEILQLEQRLYEQAANIGKIPDSKRNVKRKLRRKVDTRMWPWEGEYWADEVGYYRIDAKPDCPAGLQVGEVK